MRTRTRRATRHYFRPGRGYYADFRDFADVGGAREALIPPGSRRATMDEAVAYDVTRHRLAELDAKRAGRATDTTPPRASPRLADYIETHLALKAATARPSTVVRDRQSLAHVVVFLTERHGADVRVADVRPEEVDEYNLWRSRQSGVHVGTRVAAQTIQHELHALSNLYKRALRARLVAVNPVAGTDKPRIERDEASWLEIGQAARLLAEAGRLDADRRTRAVPFLAPILATCLLTGGRAQEVLGLTVQDVDLEHREISFRPNAWRRLKRERHRRTVPMWPQLEAILRTYLARWTRTDLLFPAEDGQMLRDLRGSLAAALTAAEISRHVTLHTLRHTYTATRVQTLDRGHPVSLFTVMRELGHSSTALIDKTYGHLQSDRTRLETVEYRVAQVVSLDERRKHA